MSLKVLVKTIDALPMISIINVPIEDPPSVFYNPPVLVTYVKCDPLIRGLHTKSYQYEFCEICK